MIEFSFVIPVYNEEDNLSQLHEELQRVVHQIGQPCEVIWIDDGSKDSSLDRVKQMAAEHPEYRFISFERNCGQSGALAAGFDAARGEYVITMDSDLQNNPLDILNMIPYLGKYDMVTGWRKDRHDTWWKKFSSRFANGVRNWLSRETIKDTGCSLKIMKTSYLKKIKMYKGLHRFLPTLMKMEGATVIEVPVSHRPRTRGVSKYGTWDRAFSGLRDLLAVRWMQDRNISYQIKEASDELSSGEAR
ncbi:MAG: glycosyltransferase family 2 protein [Desulfobacterales bacterium]|jgi:glycosyltransferase involved in cell wall biosynthesis|nr:glycosyltransferase family 2 protein [Desulfobacterales bacterium]